VIQVIQVVAAVAVSSGWLGVEYEEAVGCVRVTLVFSEGPAARAGVQEGDCLAKLGTRATRDAPSFVRAMSALEVARPVLVVFSDKRTALITPEFTSKEKETAFCRYAEARRTLIFVASKNAGVTRSTRIVTDKPLTIEQIRVRVGEPERPVRVVVGRPCGLYDAPIVMDRPGELFAVPSRSVVAFLESTISSETVMELENP
jgi:hypothetical protein